MQRSLTWPKAEAAGRRAIVTWRLAAIAWACVIFLASSMPGSSVPGRFGPLAHFIEYSVFGVLLVGALGGRRRDAVGMTIAAITLASAWGTTDELHQAFVPMRVPDPVDWLVDTGGAAVGAVVTATLLAARLRNDASGRQ